MKRIPLFVSAVLSALPLHAESPAAPPPWLFDFSAAPQRKLYWQTEPGQRYDLWESANLQGWNRVSGFPKTAEGLAMEHAFTPHPGGKGFFRIEPIDEQPPTVANQFPAVDGFAVGRFGDLFLELQDVTGIDPASVRFTVGGTGPLAPGAPGLTIAGNTITYDSGNAALGAWGETITATLVAADTLGNKLTHTWSFRLEPEPLVAANVFVFGAPVAQRSGQRVSGPAAALASRFPSAGPVTRNASSPWSIDSVAADRIVIAYGTGGPPSFAVGQLLCNLTPTKESEIFYRKALFTSDDPETSRLTVMTADVPLTGFITRGAASLSENAVIYELDESGAFTQALPFNGALTRRAASLSENTVIDEPDESGASTQALSFDGTLNFPRLGYDLSGSGFKLRPDGFEARVKGNTYSQGNSDPYLECNMSQWSWWFTPRIRTAFELEWASLKSFEATASGQVETSKVFVGTFIHSFSGVGGKWTLFDLPESLETRVVVYMQVGIVPVWAVLSFDFEVEAEAGAQVEMEFQVVSQQSTNASFGVSYDSVSGFERFHSFQNSTPVSRRVVDFAGEMSVKVTLEPEIEFLFYGLAGFEAGIEPSAKLAVRVEPEPKMCLETALDFVIEPSGPVFDALGIDGEFRKNIASFASCDEFVFTSHPESQTVKEKDDVFFECVVDVPEDNVENLKYQWFHNARPIPGQVGRTLFLSHVKPAHAGTYHVTAAIGETTIKSNQATLTVRGSVSEGFVRIPAGSFRMGDALGDGFYEERPVHTVNLREFYIGKYEVAQALWEQVRAWGSVHGYGDLRVGSEYLGINYNKGPNHPANFISWHDVVKWCNARSEMEGLVPCYRGGGGVYRQGEDDAVTCDWSAGGYRLPTEAEWEKAARGGLAGQRFPWGNTISHSQANYWSTSWYAYDVSPTRGGHPSYGDGGEPYTSPVGSFAANGYGLHDVAGNVREWCWDWWGGDYYEWSPAYYPRGPIFGFNRIARGGDWNYSGGYAASVSCRYGNGDPPHRYGSGVGFRLARSSVP